MQSTHKIIGSDSKNTSGLHQKGSILYAKYSKLHQCDQISTINGSSTVTWRTTAEHGLNNGDTVRIQKLPNNPTPVTVVNGLPASALEGSFTVTVSGHSSFSVIVTGHTATTTGVDQVAVPLVAIDRYVYIDIADPSTTSWTHSTTEPTPSHTNEQENFFS
jgi:hypothetical protein